MTTNFRSMEFKVGVFVLFCIALVISTVIYIGYKKELFSSKVKYTVVVKSGENIERGIPVRLSGFKIGQVTDVELDLDGNIKVQVEILEKYKDWMKTDSKIMVDQEGLIGNAYLKVLPGTQNAKILEPGSTIALDTSARTVSDLVAAVEPVIQDLKTIVGNVRTVTEILIDPNGSIQQILRNLEKLSATLNNKNGLLHYVSADERPVRQIDAILTDAEKSMKQIDAILAKTSVIADDAGTAVHEGKEFVTELRAMRNDLATILDNLKSVSQEVKTATKDLRRLRQQGEETLTLSNELLQRLKETWPFTREEDTRPPLPLPAP